MNGDIQAEALTVESVADSTRAGLVSLSLRSFAIHGLQVASVLILAHWLTPKDYGTYGLINAWIGVTLFFTDVGIAGALIHQNSKPTARQLQGCLAVQFGLSTLFCLFFLACAPAIARYNHLDAAAVLMLRILGLSLPIYSLRCVPRLSLERNLEFSSLAKIDFSEAFVNYCVQIGFALGSAGAWSLVLANVARAVTGTGLLYRRFRDFYLPKFHWNEIKKLMSYGLSFQANAALPALRGLVLPVVLGALLAVDKVGLITWTLGLASIPMFLAYNYNQVLFPSLSRLQSKPVEMREFGSKSTESALAAFAFVYGLGASAGVALIDLLFGRKWAGAEPFIALAALSAALSTARYLLACLMNATGRPQTRLLIEGPTVVAEFILAAWLTKRFAAEGYFWSTILISVFALGLSLRAVKGILRRRTALRFIAVTAAAAAPWFLIHYQHWEHMIFVCVGIYLAAFFGIGTAFDRRLPSDLWKILTAWRTR